MFWAQGKNIAMYQLAVVYVDQYVKSRYVYLRYFTIFYSSSKIGSITSVYLGA